MPDINTADELISAPAAQFGKNIIEVMNFLRVMTVQTVMLNEMTRKVISTLSLFPIEFRRQFIPDHTFEATQGFISRGIGVADIISLYVPLVSELVYCRSIDYYLLYISELLALIFQTKPMALKSNEQISIEFVLQYSEFKDLLDAITEKKVSSLSFKGMRVLNGELDKTLSFSLFQSQSDLTRAVEIVEKRNLFVHNRGIVNAIFLSRVSPSDKKLGDELSRNEKVLRDDLIFLSEAVTITDRVAANKFGIPRRELAPTSDLPIPSVADIKMTPVEKP